MKYQLMNLEYFRVETTPFPIEDTVNVNTELRLKYRYLDLRRNVVAKNIIAKT